VVRAAPDVVRAAVGAARTVVVLRMKLVPWSAQIYRRPHQNFTGISRFLPAGYLHASPDVVEFARKHFCRKYGLWCCMEKKEIVGRTSTGCLRAMLRYTTGKRFTTK
jgi:hypothetical protein